MPDVRLPDGAVKHFDAPVTVAQVASAIGPGLAKAALAGRIDGKLVDTSFLIDRDASLAIVTDKDADGLEVLRHSTAHLLAYAVKELFPDAQVTIGPVIEDGFYYDFSYKRPFTPEDLAAIEQRMTEFSRKRWNSQPAAPSAGCIFKNPPLIPAGKLIDELGLKGSRVGGAVVSAEHGNFIVNDHAATARNILDLIEFIRQRVRTERGIELETEVEIVGQ